MYSPSEPICILDDDPSVRKSLARLLESHGLPALTFGAPEDFLAHARAHTVCVAVLDVDLPTTSGLKVQQRLREFSPATRVIVMTGRDEPGLRASALKGGAIGFFAKPFDAVPFLSLIRQALGQAA